MNKHLPLVSVITVSLDSISGLRSTIKSVSHQDFQNKEFILIDGGSTDGTKELIHQHENQFTYWSSEPDHGPFDAMNKGLSKATGEWVIFMNAGDTFAGPDVLSRIFNRDLDQTDVIYGDCIVDYGRFRLLKQAGKSEDFRKGMPFSHQSMLVRTPLAKTMGFNLSYPVSADYNMVLNLFFEGKRFLYFHEPISIIETQGISHRNMIRSAREHFQIAGLYRKPSSVDKFGHWVYLSFLKMITLAYRMLPMRSMLFFIKLINSNKLVSFTNQELK